ncbi:MAG: hypothetical protein FH749_12030 [Firmicutes bacterium]|nr:hypothetical protein [Bacillota bacterium]
MFIKKHRKLFIIFLTGLILLGLIIGFTSLNAYNIRRSELYVYLSDLDRKLEKLQQSVTASPESQPDLLETIDSIRAYNNSVTNNLNLLERSTLRRELTELTLDAVLITALETIYLRHSRGLDSNREHEFIARVETLLQENSRVLSEARQIKSGTFGRLLVPLNVEVLAENYQQINRLATFYMRYNRLPEELAPVHLDQLEVQIREIWGAETAIVDFPDHLNRNIDQGFTYVFEIRDQGQRIQGQVDAYSGQILFLGRDVIEYETDGETHPMYPLQEDLKALLTRMYGPEYTFSITPKSINHELEVEAGAQLYTFAIEPRLNGYRLETRPLLARFDAYTGKLVALTPSISVPDNPVNTEITINRAAARQVIAKEAEFRETVIIPSRVSGDWVLAHMFNAGGDQIYVDAQSGERVYYNPAKIVP